MWFMGVRVLVEVKRVRRLREERRWTVLSEEVVTEIGDFAASCEGNGERSERGVRRS